ncbi:MAG: GNAT family N-acetyltransferase [Bdellovibrionota bacterium]
MKIGNSIEIGPAKISEVDQIIRIYQLIYGKNYPISYGNDPELLAHAISSPESHTVLIARDLKKGIVIGALVLEKDLFNKIGLLLGLVVLPEYRNHKIANHLVTLQTKLNLEDDTKLNSLYATTRTVNVGPQVVFQKNNFLPLGILPNAHRLARYETVTVFAKYRKGILEGRKSVGKISPKIIPLYQIVKKLVPQIEIPEPNPLELEEPLIEEDWEYEVIQEAHYVKRKFLETYPEPSDRFYPFHNPNILVADKKGRVEIFAHFSKRDGYCTIIKSSIPLFLLHGHYTSLYLQLHDIGVTYLEVLVNAKAKRSIEALLKGSFLPSAIYPAMRETIDNYEDYIVMSRTMEPLNFKGMAIISQFKPYIDQYVDLWKKLNLDSLEIVNGE